MATGSPGSPLRLTESNFDQTIKQARAPVLVDFWAAWCPPCRALEPTIQDVAQGTRGSAVVAKVNVDEAAALAQRYAIRAIPTMIIFKDGKEVDRIVGVHDAATLIERLGRAAA